jgi:hypothetical protein
VKKSFNIQELLHPKSKGHGIKAHAPLLVESFSKTPKFMESSPHTPPCGKVFQDSKGHGIKAHAPLLVESFSKTPKVIESSPW